MQKSSHSISALLSRCLQVYRARYPGEEEIISQFEELLTQAHCFSRETCPAHFTGSAWIVDPHRSKVLLMHHPKLFKWLQPGGHLEEGEFPWEATAREVKEEVGLKIDFVDRQGELIIPFDLDRHFIPARGALKEHWHYDFLFLVHGNEEAEIGGDEGLDLKWFDFEDVCKPGFELSLERVVHKTISTGSKKL